MLTVLQVTPRLDAGGVERTTIEIAEALTRRGVRALVASAGGRLEPALAAAGGTLVRMDMATKNPLTVWANGDRLAGLVRTEGVALVHARSRAPAWSALRAARRTRTPFVTTYHGIYNARSAPKRLYNSVMACGDVVIANSEYTRRHVIAAHGTAPGRVVTIVRGVDLERFDPARLDPVAVAEKRADWGVPAGHHVLLVFARITAWKGQAVAIDALAALPAGLRARTSLVLAGDAQGRAALVQALQARAAAAGLGAQVLLPGHEADGATALAAADIVLAPSIEPEAFGRAVVEAQAMARPVVATALGGHLETVLDGDTGRLVPAGDAAAMAQAVAALLANPEGAAAMGARAAVRVRAAFTTRALQDATLDVYARLVPGFPCAA